MSIEQRVIAILEDDLRLQPGVIKPELFLVDDLAVSSLDVVYSLMSLEDAFKIVFEEKDHEHIKTVQDVIDLVNKLVK
jgi:acyl carrier protein